MARCGSSSRRRQSCNKGRIQELITNLNGLALFYSSRFSRENRTGSPTSGFLGSSDDALLEKARLHAQTSAGGPVSAIPLI